MPWVPLVLYDRPPPAPDLMGPDGLNIADAYARVSAALRADKAPVVPKSCKTCYGEGWMGCAMCGGTGTRMTT